MAFSFRLQSYLGVKEQLEEQKKNEYGVAMRQLETERQKKRKLEQELDENVSSFKSALAVTIVAADIRRYNNRIEILKGWILEQEEQVKKAESFAETKRLELMEAVKERKALETVKERNYEEYIIEEKKAEQSVTDGIVSYKYAEKVIG